MIQARNLAATLPDTIDLRRRRRRDVAEQIVHRARWSLPEDRAVLGAIFADGLSASQVAQMRNESPRRVRRRVRLLVDRVLSDRYRFVLQHRDAWPAGRRRIASACVLQGHSMRECARRLRVSLHRVRREMDIVNALFTAQG